ncbi:MAG: hypothetical protein IJU76_07600 [Desulfovibrionaceae bacterium]|nr:hypothetical protein [Desulfovibrionaceae bacterium]
MNNKQRLALNDFLANWNKKASLGCLIVGLFQRDHIFGGIIGSIVCFLIALTLKIWSAQNDLYHGHCFCYLLLPLHWCRRLFFNPQAPQIENFRIRSRAAMTLRAFLMDGSQIPGFSRRFPMRFVVVWSLTELPSRVLVSASGRCVIKKEGAMLPP